MVTVHALPVVTVFAVERCYDYEGCSLERVFGTRDEAEAYVEERKKDSCADWPITEWEVAVPRVSEDKP